MSQTSRPLLLMTTYFLVVIWVQPLVPKQKIENPVVYKHAKDQQQKSAQLHGRKNV
jgi:heme exporter protein D